MEIFLTVLALIIIFSLYLLGWQINRVSSRLEDSDRKQQEILAVLDQINTSLGSLNSEQHRSLLALRESLEATKPIKPNNWDSMKEAFKGPTRVEVNERN
jgi:hypothetical protein